MDINLDWKNQQTRFNSGQICSRNNLFTLQKSLKIGLSETSSRGRTRSQQLASI